MKKIEKKLDKKLTIIGIIVMVLCVGAIILFADSNLPLTATVVSKEDAVAKISYAGRDIYVDSFTDAWFYVNEITDQDMELTLYEDWVAIDGSFGTGTGYGDTGNLTPVDRDKKSIKLTIDLNGHTIDRNLDSPIKSGNIISIKKDGVYTIKNGTLTGGNTTDRGGALWLDNDETKVNLENVVITGNHADGNGGGIFIKTCDLTLNIKDSTIINNTSNNYGGGMYVSKNVRKVNVSGLVTIKDNTGKNNRNNLTLQKKDTVAPIDIDANIKDCRDLTEGSVIYVSTSDLDSKRIAIYAEKESENYFFSDSPKFKSKYVVYSGGTSDLYLTDIED